MCDTYILVNMQPAIPQHPDHVHRVGQEFAHRYYTTTSTQGVNVALDLFQPNVTCTMDSDEFTGSYNWLLRLTRAGASRFDYQNLTGVSQAVGTYEILVHVSGLLRVVGLHNQYGTNWLRFNEVFLLERQGSNYQVKNYILRILR